MVDVLNFVAGDCAKKDNNNFTIHFKKRWHQAIQLRFFRNITYQRGIIPKFFRKQFTKSLEELLDRLEYDARISRKRLGFLYFCIPRRVDK